MANRYRFSYGRQANRTLKNIRVPDLTELPAFVPTTDVDRFDGSDLARIEQPTPVLETVRWKHFTIGNLFEIRKGQRLTKADMLPGNVPYIPASDSANGTTAHVGQGAIHQGGTISVSYNGSVAEAFYQPTDYWATDDVNVLYPKGFVLTPTAALFVCTVIRREKYRFNYGRKWHLDRMREATIKLPEASPGQPDWAYMQRYVMTLPYSSQIE